MTGRSGAGPVIRAVLPNDMVVVVRENAAAPVAALTLLVGGGCADETPDTNGVTALLGRVLLKGTRTRNALELAQTAEDAGGTLEHATDQEYVELRARGLARHWPSLLGVVHEMATAPRLASDEVERERAALLAQLRALEDQPFQVANRLLSRALYATHPYGLPPGDAAVVARLGAEDLRRHFERSFTPARMVLAVSGAVTASEVVAEAARLFGGIPAGPAERPGPPPPSRPAEPRVVEPRPAEQTQLLVGFLAPPVAHPDYPALKVLNAVLGSGMSSRLFRALRDERGLAYAVGSFYPTRRASSRLVVHIGTAPLNGAEAEAGIARELARLQEEPVPATELERARAFLAGTFELEMRTNGRHSFFLGFFELLGVGHGWTSRYREAIEAVTSEDVARVARRWLVEPAVAVVGPG